MVPLGGEVKQYQILVDPVRLEAFDVTLEDVLRAAEGSNVNASGGVFMDRGQEYLIRATGRVQHLDDIAQTVLAVREGTPVTVGDVAQVRIGPATRLGERIRQCQPGRHPHDSKATQHEHAGAHHTNRSGTDRHRAEPPVRGWRSTVAFSGRPASLTPRWETSWRRSVTDRSWSSSSSSCSSGASEPRSSRWWPSHSR